MIPMSIGPSINSVSEFGGSRRLRDVVMYASLVVHPIGQTKDSQADTEESNTNSRGRDYRVHQAMAQDPSSKD